MSPNVTLQNGQKWHISPCNIGRIEGVKVRVAKCHPFDTIPLRQGWGGSHSTAITGNKSRVFKKIVKRFWKTLHYVKINGIM